MFEPSSDNLIERLSELGRRDREAVLNHLSHDRRTAVENALHHLSEERRVEEERQRRIDRQFLGYSPWLASVIERCEHSQPSHLTEAAAAALWSIHEQSVSSRPPKVRSGWLGVTDRLIDAIAPFGKASA